MVKVEVCAFSLESCLNAERAGAHRIELCSGPGEGGTTPSSGLVSLVKTKVSIPVYAMIRPRGGDFVYDEMELETMLSEIDALKKIGVDGVVMGALRPDGTVDQELMKLLVEAAHPLGITFHRAFDVTSDPYRTMDFLVDLGIERILTSGLEANVDAGMGMLKKLVAYAKGRIEIMAGGGVRPSNVAELIGVGVDCIHLTAKSFRQGQQVYFPKKVSMASEIPDERSVMYSDPTLLKQVVDLIH